MLQKPLATLPLLLGTLLLTACGEFEPTPAKRTVQDSAGIRIVENLSPLWQPGQEWRIQEQPSLEIGQVDGPGEYLLHRIRGATQLGDGRIAVLNAGTNELRYYDSSGHYLGFSGGTGEGPGEFRRTAGLVRSGDTLFIWDTSQCRLSWFHSSGSFEGSEVVDSYQDVGGATGPLSCNRVTLQTASFLLLQETVPRRARTSDDDVSEIHRPPTAYVLVPVESRRARSLGVFKGIEQQTVDRIPLKPPFSRSTQVTSAYNPFRICIGEQETTEIACYDSEMAKTLIRWDAVVERVSPKDIAHWRENPMEALTLFGAERLQRAMNAATIREFRPPFSTIHLDLEGNLWVLQMPPLGATPLVQAYWVFDPEGRWLGEVRFSGDEIFEIGDDYILAKHRNELDVESIRLYRVQKD